MTEVGWQSRIREGLPAGLMFKHLIFKRRGKKL